MSVNGAVHREAGRERSREQEVYGKLRIKRIEQAFARWARAPNGGTEERMAVVQRRVRSTGSAHANGGKKVLHLGCTWNEPRNARRGRTRKDVGECAWGRAWGEALYGGCGFGEWGKPAETGPNMERV